MRTKEQLRDIIARRLESNDFKNATFADLVQAVSGATVAQKNLLIKALVSGNNKKTGELLQSALKAYVKQQAIIQADTFLADDLLSLAELNEII